MSTSRDIVCKETSPAFGNGVIYYKFASGYTGDVTKDCGLAANEIDNNFYFLRGYDIESCEYDKETGILTLTRVNGEILPVTIGVSEGTSVQDIDFNFDSTTGTLIITYPDGTTTNVSGFTVNGLNEIAIDRTLLGNGEPSNPLRLNPIEGTGTYAPAHTYMDLTEEDAEFPISGANQGYRIVTKEYSNALGRLYDFNAVETINNKLAEEANGWRVPTKEDFDLLLNALECDEYKNHSATTIGSFGKAAGQALKSKYFWNEYDSGFRNDTNGTDRIGMTILPTGNDDGDDEIGEEFGKISVLWTSTYRDEEQVYVKKLSYDKADVRQEVHDKTCFNAIRLIKDYNLNNHSEIETILGLSYPTVLVRIPDSNYIKIWTKINVYNEDEELNSISANTSNVDLSDIETVYYVNEWDGTKWVKKQLREGDSIVILQKDDTEYREWRLKFGELHDVFSEDFAINDMLDSINELSAQTKNLSASTVYNITNINETITNVSEEINSRIDELSANTNTFGNGLKVEDKEVSIKIDENDEGFLYVGEDGLKTDGINEAIETAKNEAITSVLSSITDSLSGITVDFEKYNIYSDDVINVETASTGTNLSLNIDATLRKTDNRLGTNIRIQKNNNVYSLVYGDGYNHLGEDIVITDNGTVKLIKVDRDNSTINTDDGTFIPGDDTGVKALCIVYKDENGRYCFEKTSLNDLLSDKYAGNGIEIKSLSDTGYTKIMTKLHSDQQYLGVDEDGLYLSGVTEGLDSLKECIDNKIETSIEQLKTELRQEISAYTDQAITNLYNGLVTSGIQDTVKTYISGTPYEIMVNEINPMSPMRKLIIGFTDDALFGPDRVQ